MAQARTGNKNLVGGLLVPWEVVDSRALIIERSFGPSFKPIQNVIDSASIKTKWAKVTMPNQSRVIRFGIFEVDLQAGEVRKAGLRQRLAGQPFQVLQVLLERPQDIVTRQELRERIWPGNTFVDYELALKKAVSRLREVLGDSAESPHFIETIPRRGYRFIGTISPQSIPPESREPRSTAADDSLERPAVQTSARLSWRLIAAFSLAAIAALLLSLNADRLRTRIFARSPTPKIHSIAVLPLQKARRSCHR
jgi:DNA-binding winged helix-turn-helix (wHTH) protein